MRLLDWFLGRAEPAPVRDSTRAAFSTLQTLYATPDAERILPQFQYLAEQAYGGNAVVFSVIDKRLKLFSEATFKFRSLTDKHLFGTPALAKLETPWPNGSTGELLARMEQDVSLAGNCYIRDAGDRLERLRPDWVTIISEVHEDPTGRQIREVIGYWYEPVGDSARRGEYYDVDEIAHWSPLLDPLANFRGMSWLTPVIREINADTSMSAHRDAYFRNAASPNIVIKYQKRLTDPQFDRIRDAVAARHAGAENAFSTMVLDEGADLTVVGSDMQGSAFAALQQAGEQRIAAAGGVPARIAGINGTLGSAAPKPGELADDMRLLADMLLRPNWRTACAALATIVQVPAGAQLWFDVTDISALRQGEKDAADTMAAQATTMSTLIMAGFTPESIVRAVVAADPTLLEHSGMTSVQLYKPGENNSNATPDNPPPAAPDRAEHLRAADVSSGAMVALVPAQADAERLAVDGGEPADELHCTLLYLGKAADWPADARTAVTEVMRRIGAALDPVRSNGFALSMFNPDSAEPCIVLGLSGNDLGLACDLAREGVTDALLGGRVPQQHTPFVPHVTLQYTDDAAQIANLTNRVGPITFDRIRVAFAGHVTDIPLDPQPLP